MAFRRPGSVTERLTRSLLVGLTVLWLTGVLGSGVVLKHLIDEKSDDELQESGMILMTLVRHIDDPLVTAALLGETTMPPHATPPHERLVYQVRDRSGQMLMRSSNAPPELLGISLEPGFVDVHAWRVLTLEDREHGHFLQLADPLAERRDALVKSLAWLTVPLAALLAFAVFILFRASHSLVQQVRRTANAVSRQDPQALGLLPLDGVVTEMRPAVEATNHLLARLAAAFEAERSFTYNSAHELRTPIAAALAQAQLLAARAEETALQEPAGALVAALSRLARLAERLLALARADGAQALADDWVDLSRVIRLDGRRVQPESPIARAKHCRAGGIRARARRSGRDRTSAAQSRGKCPCPRRRWFLHPGHLRRSTRGGIAGGDRRWPRRCSGGAPVAGEALRSRAGGRGERRRPRPLNRRYAGQTHGCEARAGQSAGRTSQRL